MGNRLNEVMAQIPPYRHCLISSNLTDGRWLGSYRSVENIPFTIEMVLTGSCTTPIDSHSKENPCEKSMRT